jgi:hypothetical protein
LRKITHKNGRVVKQPDSARLQVINRFAALTAVQDDIGTSKKRRVTQNWISSEEDDSEVDTVDSATPTGQTLPIPNAIALYHEDTDLIGSWLGNNPQPTTNPSETENSDGIQPSISTAVETSLSGTALTPNKEPVNSS